MQARESAVAVVILNWNGKAHLKSFLPSVIAHLGGAKLYVADNGSTDDSVPFLQTNFPEVFCIELDQNYGFCGGYNRALQKIEAKYYVLLNSDVEVPSEWLMPMLTWMEENPRTAICQPLMLDYKNRSFFEYAGAAGGLIDRFGYPFCRGRIFQSIEENQGQYDTPAVPVFWASGACMMIRSEIYHALGGLDEFLFAHMEEIDLCWRAQRQGYAVVVVPQSKVYHLGGGTLHKTNPRKTYLNFRNSLYVWHKNHAKLFPLFELLIRLLLDGVAGLYFLAAGHYKDTLAIVKAHFAYYFQIPKLIQWKRDDFKLRKHQHGAAVYPRSIVWDYFILGRKKYTDL